MTRPTRLAALCLAGAFVAGALFGLVAHSVYTQRTTAAAPSRAPRDVRTRYLNRLETRLSLTAGQRDQVTAILEETGDRFREVRDRMEPEFDAIRTRQREKISALLTPAQQAEYQKLIEEQRRRHAEQRSRGH